MKYYKISEQELRYLIKRDYILRALEAGGVDNWDYYGEALRNMREYYNVEDIEEIVDKDLKENYEGDVIC